MHKEFFFHFPLIIFPDWTFILFGVDAVWYRKSSNIFEKKMSNGSALITNVLSNFTKKNSQSLSSSVFLATLPICCRIEKIKLLRFSYLGQRNQMGSPRPFPSQLFRRYDIESLVHGQRYLCARFTSSQQRNLYHQVVLYRSRYT